jgi:hypothetical protein
MLSADAIVELHDQRTRSWHQSPGKPDEAASFFADPAPNPEANAGLDQDWSSTLARQHKANFDLWHLEDEARAPGATDTELANVKRRVDLTNQLRNDLAEELDRILLGWLKSKGLPNSEAPLHSESPGLIVDRLSILGLKIHHTREEAQRADAPAAHIARNRERLSILEEQRTDLAGCLDALWRETLAGNRRFKLYRQLKMYNDPALNPAIYRKTPPKLGG